MRSKYIQYWDDERSIDNGIIVTLAWGWSFYANEHQGVMGFDTKSEAVNATKRKNIYPCNCSKCKRLDI